MATSTFLDRFTVRPRHLEQWEPVFEAQRALYARHGFESVRVFIETDAEPKVTWLYEHEGRDAAAARSLLVGCAEHRELEALAAPHVFRNRLVRPVVPEVLTRATTESVRGERVAERIAIMRRYSIVGSWEDFLEVWRRIVPVREAYGFRCLFAVRDEEKDMFTWAFDFDGAWEEFPDAQRGYYRDPARVELRGVFDFMADYSLHPARQIALP